MVCTLAELLVRDTGADLLPRLTMAGSTKAVCATEAGAGAGAGAGAMAGAAKVVGGTCSLYSATSAILPGSSVRRGIHLSVPRWKTAILHQLVVHRKKTQKERACPTIAQHQARAGRDLADGSLELHARRVPQRHHHLQADEVHLDCVAGCCTTNEEGVSCRRVYAQTRLGVARGVQ
jgi:hypothetical protein